MKTMPQQQVYTDLNGLNSLKQSAKTDEKAAIREAAKQFESVFVRMVLKSMREANDVISEGGIFSSEQSKFFQGMYDDQLALNLSQGQGLGLTDVLVEQLSPAVGKTTHTAPEHMSMDFPAVKGVSSLNAGASQFSVNGRNLTPSPQRENKQDLNQLLILDNDNGTNSALNKSNAVNWGSIQIDSPSHFNSAEDFVQKVWPYAQQAAKKLGGLDPKVLVAQAALETGWGQHISQDQNGVSSMNLFNIKADKRWNGPQVNVSTVEFKQGVTVRENAAFRQYASVEQSFNDYVDFLKSNPRYQQALSQVGNAGNYIQSLQNAGYATDPKYAQKVMRVMQSDLLNTSVAFAE